MSRLPSPVVSPVAGDRILTRRRLVPLLLCGPVAVASMASGLRPQANPLYSVDDRVAQFGAAVALRLKPHFANAGVVYPPAEVAFVAFKDQRDLQVYARSSARGPWHFVRRYAVRAASGSLGPKLKEGDRQVPEGLYRAEALNPNSRFHLSVRLNYPNAFDRRMAAADGRTTLGGDIMIHGNAVSIGCLAMGDQAAEDLFVLAALVAKEHVQVVISPTDFRRARAAVPRPVGPAWLPVLHADLRAALAVFPVPPAA